MLGIPGSFVPQPSPCNASNLPQVFNNSSYIQNPLTPVLMHSLGQAVYPVRSPLAARHANYGPSKMWLYEVHNLKEIAQNPQKPVLERVQAALYLPESEEKNTILKNLILEGNVSMASTLGNCFLGITDNQIREEALGSYLNHAGNSLHSIITQCKAEIQGRLLGVLTQHSKILMRLIENETLPFFWRLYYTCMLGADVCLADRNTAESCVLNNYQGASALAIIEDIRVATKHYPKSLSRNSILAQFIDKRELFTSEQRIDLLSLMGESPETDNKALALSQEEAFFTLDQQEDCIAYMSPSPQKEMALKALKLKRQNLVKIDQRAA